MAFLPDVLGGVHALSPELQPAWNSQLQAGTATSAALAPDDSALFVGTLDGEVHALDTTTGTRIWSTKIETKTDPRILSAILTLPDSILLSSWGGRWTQLSSKDGRIMASWDAGIYPQSAAAASAKGDVFILRAAWDKGLELVQLHPDGSETILHLEPQSSRGPRRMLAAANPIVDAATNTLHCVFNHDTESVLKAFDLTNQSLLHASPLPACVQAAPALAPNGSTRIADLAGHLLSINAEGTIEWSYKTNAEYLLASPVVDAAGNTWLGDPLGQIHAVNAKGQGNVRHTATRSIEVQPSVSPTGQLAVPTSDGTVLFLA
jgi:outer membrane protein assembly factor BamB